jgi:hypothetical protein
MSEWTRRELKGIELLLAKLKINPKEPTRPNQWIRCHKRVIFEEPLGDFTKLEWHELGKKLHSHHLVDHGRDYAWDVNFGRLVPLLDARLSGQSIKTILYSEEGWHLYWDTADGTVNLHVDASQWVDFECSQHHVRVCIPTQVIEAILTNTDKVGEELKHAAQKSLEWKSEKDNDKEKTA